MLPPTLSLAESGRAAYLLQRHGGGGSRPGGLDNIVSPAIRALLPDRRHFPVAYRPADFILRIDDPRQVTASPSRAREPGSGTPLK